MKESNAATGTATRRYDATVATPRYVRYANFQSAHFKFN